MQQLNSLLLGFGHKAKNGKDHVARHIQSVFGDEWVIESLSFGYFIKQEVNEAIRECGGMFELFYQLASKKYGHGAPPLDEWVRLQLNPDMSDPLCPYGKQRTLLQWWGEEYRRAQDPFYWVKKFHAHVQKMERSPQIILIPDVRRKTECYFVKAMGGEMVNVVRPGFYDPNSNPTHITETELDSYKYDHRIEASSVEQLEEYAERLFLFLMEKRTVEGQLKAAGVTPQ
jgi:hypothetical protein